MIKLVLFDVDGVLVRHSDDSTQETLFQKFGLTENDLAPHWNSDYQDLMLGKKQTIEFLDAFAKRHKIPRAQLLASDFSDGYMKDLEITPGMEDLLKKLSEKVQLALLSDTSEFIHSSRREMRIFSYFDRHFLSYDLGALKPERRTFQAVLEHYQLQPSEVFFIDDRAENVQGAKKLGMDGVVFTNYQDLQTALKSRKLL